MPSYRIRRTWRELRRDEVVVEADSADDALELAADWDEHPLSDVSEFLEADECHLTTDESGTIHEKWA